MEYFLSEIENQPFSKSSHFLPIPRLKDQASNQLLPALVKLALMQRYYWTMSLCPQLCYLIPIAGGNWTVLRREYTTYVKEQLASLREISKRQRLTCHAVRQDVHIRWPHGSIFTSLSFSAHILHSWNVEPISQYNSYCSWGKDRQTDMVDTVK